MVFLLLLYMNVYHDSNILSDNVLEYRNQEGAQYDIVKRGLLNTNKQSLYHVDGAHVTPLGQ